MRGRIISRVIHKLDLVDLQGDAKWAVCGNVYNGVLCAGDFNYALDSIPGYNGIAVVTFGSAQQGKGLPTVVRKCNGNTCELYKHKILYNSIVSDKPINIDTALVPIELLTCGAEQIYIHSKAIQVQESKFMGDAEQSALIEKVLSCVPAHLRQLYADNELTAALQIAVEKLGVGSESIWCIKDKIE